MALAILDDKHKPECIRYRTYQLAYPRQVIVCCAVYLTANGNLIRADIGDNYEYEIEDIKDNIIGNVHDDLYDCIQQFNENKLTCFDHMLIEKQNEESYNSYTRHNLKFAVSHINDVISMVRNSSNNINRRFDRSISIEEEKELNNPLSIEAKLNQMRSEIRLNKEK